MTPEWADDGLAERFDGIDGPRPLPAALVESLQSLLTGDDPVAVLASTGTDDPRPLPASVHDRVASSLARRPEGTGGQGGDELVGRRRRGLRLITGGASPGLLQAVAVAAAVVLVAGTVSLAAELSGSRGAPVAIDPLLPPRAGPTTTLAPPPSTTTSAPPRKPAELVALADCDELLGHFKSNALALVGKGQIVPWQQYSGRVVATREEAMAADGAAASSGASGSGTPSSAPPSPVDASSTNVQEAGVDEPDTVKTEAGRVFTVTHDARGPVIRALRPRAGGATLLGTFDLPQGVHAPQLLLSGDRLLALATMWVQEQTDSGVRRGGEWTRIWVLDVSNPAELRLTDVVSLEGSYTTARLANGLVRVVINSGGSGPAFAHPQGGQPDYEAKLRASVEQAVRESSLDDWVPNYVHEQHRPGKEPVTKGGRACACDDTLRPVDFSGFGSVTVLTIDPKDPKPDNVASVTGAGAITYASATDLFVSSARHVFRPVEPAGDAPARSAAASGSPGWGMPHETSIHQFSIEAPEASYVASGKVPGALLNQFSMSQHDGHLRVASTLYDSERENGIDNVVSVLRREGERLVVTGWVAGLGAPGERIHGVRMIGDTGYVVTFRQIDPLYVLDLTNPNRPRVLGELKIPGVSTYLHPMDPGHLIGIGAEATDQGRRTGLGMSVFDVRNRAAPKRSAHLVLGNGQSEAERNHHAFLYWPRTSTAVVPYLSFDHSDGEGGMEASAVVVRATPTALTELGRVSHLGRDAASSESGHDGRAMIQRSAVIGNDLWTFSSVGVLISDLETLDERAWVGYFAG